MTITGKAQKYRGLEMIRYIIQDTTTGKFLKRTKSYGVTNKWVTSADDVTLITTGSAASQIATRFCNGETYRTSRARYHKYPVKVIKVNVLIYPAGLQPFMEGVLNGK